MWTYARLRTWIHPHTKFCCASAVLGWPDEHVPPLASFPALSSARPQEIVHLPSSTTMKPTSRILALWRKQETFCAAHFINLRLARIWDMYAWEGHRESGMASGRLATVVASACPREPHSVLKSLPTCMTSGMHLLWHAENTLCEHKYCKGDARRWAR